MTQLQHTCGAIIGYRVAENGRHSDATFECLETYRAITRCPDCGAILYDALVAGDLLDLRVGEGAAS